MIFIVNLSLGSLDLTNFMKFTILKKCEFFRFLYLVLKLIKKSEVPPVEMPKRGPKLEKKP